MKCVFIVIPRREFNTRIESLLKLVGQYDRLVSNSNDALIQSRKKIDYKFNHDLIDNILYDGIGPLRLIR